MSAEQTDLKRRNDMTHQIQPQTDNQAAECGTDWLRITDSAGKTLEAKNCVAFLAFQSPDGECLTLAQRVSCVFPSEEEQPPVDLKEAVELILMQFDPPRGATWGGSEHVGAAWRGDYTDEDPADDEQRRDREAERVAYNARYS